MASALKNLSTYDDSSIPDGDKLQIGIVLAEYHTDITHPLYEGCYDTLLKHGVKADNIHTQQVPGAFELTAGAKLVAMNRNLDAVICLGCVIKGETPHNDYINQAVASGLTTLGIATSRPHIFGLLTPNTHQQALDRAGGKHGNKGVEAAVAALRMASIKQSVKTGKKTIGFGA